MDTINTTSNNAGESPIIATPIAGGELPGAGLQNINETPMAALPSEAAAQGSGDSGGETQPKQDAKRFEYWQSQAARWKAQAERNEELARMAQTLIQTKAPPEPAVPEIPKLPQRPASYDEVEAFNDPRSESFRYRKSMEEYRDAALVAMAQREQLREQREREAREAQRQEAEQREKLKAIQAALIGQYGFSPEESVQFLQDMAQPYELDDLTNFWRMKRSKRQPETSPGSMEQRQSRAEQFPLPAGAVPSETVLPVDEQRVFSEAMLSKYSPHRRK